MIIMFFLVVVFGSLPLRMKAFKESKLILWIFINTNIKFTVLALAGGFSGGLFLSVGLLHLLPEANERFEDYYEEEDGETP